MPRESVQEMEHLSSLQEAEVLSRARGKKRGRPQLMLDLCKGKSLPFMALQMVDLPYLTLDATLQHRWKGLKEIQKCGAKAWLFKLNGA